MTSQSRKAKEKEVSQLTDELKASKATVLVDYSGMDVGLQQELKKRLGEAGAVMKVVKNTLLKLAGTGAKLPSQAFEDEVLTGQTAVVMAESDPVSPIQVLGKFIKEFELPSLKVGVVEGDYMDQKNLLTLSELPSKDQLGANVVGAVGAPLYGLVGILNTKMEELLFVLQNAKGGDR